MSGFLSSLLGVGCECHGYKVRIVGHSLGGSVATLLGLRVSTFLVDAAVDIRPPTLPHPWEKK